MIPWSRRLDSSLRFRTFLASLSVLIPGSLSGCCTVQSSPYPVSDHFDGKKFSNPWAATAPKSFKDFLKWQFTSQKKEWPKGPLANTGIPNLITPGSSASIHVTWLGHATVLIQNESHTFITDPILFDRASPVRFAGPKRVRPAALTLDQLPKIDSVLISHNHYDHLDLASLKALHQKDHPLFIVPLGNANLLKENGIDRVIELDWFQSLPEEHFQKENGTLTLVPVQHWSARGIFDRNEALWGGYVMEISKKKIFFGGDTGYGPHFRSLFEKMGEMDLSLIPIGAYEPRWFMKDQHMNPEDAVLAHKDLHSPQSFAIHFETFQLTDEGIDEPRLELQNQLKRHAVPPSQFLAPQVGETLVIQTEHKK